MWHLRVCLLTFVVLGVVVSGLADDKCTDIPGKTDQTPNLSTLEWTMKKTRICSVQKPKGPAVFFSATLNEGEQDLYFIPPGLKWCGDGDRAESLDDLGRYKQIDACCRAHDTCTCNIVSGAKLGNLWNNGCFTKSACTCDHAFHKCLKDVLANKSTGFMERTYTRGIGNTYFGMVKPQCVKCVCSAKGEVDDSTQCTSDCTKYEWANNPSW